MIASELQKHPLAAAAAGSRTDKTKPSMSFYKGRAPDIEAEVTYLPISSGGRSAPVYSGYRPNHLITDAYLTSGYHEYLDKEEVVPGDTARAHIWFIAPDAYPHTMWVGKIIRVQEGSRLVGHAEILKIFNKTLERIDSL